MTTPKPLAVALHQVTHEQLVAIATICGFRFVCRVGDIVQLERDAAVELPAFVKNAPPLITFSAPDWSSTGDGLGPKVYERSYVVDFIGEITGLPRTEASIRLTAILQETAQNTEPNLQVSGAVEDIATLKSED